MRPLPSLRLAYKPRMAALALFVLAGCAQQGAGLTPDSYRDSTESDARHQAQGRSTAQAAPQLVMGFGDTGSRQSPAAETAAQPSGSQTRVRALTEPRTFLGTVPCLTADRACAPSRITLTLAPAGQWRARTVSLNDSTSATPIVQQGCWSVVGTQPLRITLQTTDENSLATLAFVNDNVLRIALFQGITPTLDYSLTRQADIDPIDEIQSQTALQCSP